jgi:ribosomal protein S27E
MTSGMAEQAQGGPKAAKQAGDSPLRRPACPGCGEPWLRPTQLPGRFRCVYCLSRYELVSQCPDCGEHQTIARMSSSEDMRCQSCGGSMLKAI